VSHGSVVHISTHEHLYVPLHFVLPSTYLISMVFNIMAEIAADIQITLLVEVEQAFVYSIHAQPEAYLSLTSA